MERKEKKSRSPEGARRATGGDREQRGRFSARRKAEAVLRLIRGDNLDTLSRELGVTAVTLAEWRDRFLAGGETCLRSRPADERVEEIQRLRAKIGEITMSNELLLERCHALEGQRPLARRKRRP